MDPVLRKLGLPAFLMRRAKDAYIQSVLPITGRNEDILKAAAAIRTPDVNDYATQWYKDYIGDNVEGGDQLLEKIEKSGGDPFAWGKRRGLDKPEIKTDGEFNRVAGASVVTPDELSLKVDKAINKVAPFIKQLPLELQDALRGSSEVRVAELAAQAGMDVADFLDENLLNAADIRAFTEVELNRVFRKTQDIGFDSIVKINADGSILDFLLENEADFRGRTVEDIIEFTYDVIGIDAAIAGESQDLAKARGIVQDEKNNREREKETKGLRDAKTLHDLQREAETREDTERREDLELQESLRNRELVQPFQQAFDAQAGKFLFGARGREVTADVGAQALRDFESRINVTRDRVSGDTGETPSFQELLGGNFPEVGTPDAKRSVVQQFTQENFGADFFTQAARKSRQSRTPAPRVGVARQQAVPEFRLGATGGR